MNRKAGSLQVQISVPSYFLCPISLELMTDPVTLRSGHTFDRPSIQQWLNDGHLSCPVTRQPVDPSDLHDDLIPNHTLRRMIQAWCVQHASYGVERVLTPQAPPSLKDIPLLLDRLSSTCSPSSHDSLDAIQKLIRFALDRPRSCKAILQSGALPLLAKLLSRSVPGLAPSFTSVASVPTPRSLSLAEEALKLLDLLIDPELYGDFDLQQLSSHEELILSLANALLRTTTSESKLRAASILWRLQPSECLRRKMGEMQGFIAALLEMIRECDVSSGAMFGLLVNVCTVSNRNRVIAIEAGAVGALGRLLTDGKDDKAMTEMALKALEVLCQCAEGRAALAAQEDILPTVVKHMSGTSERASYYAVHILSLVVKWIPEADKVKSTALQHGALLKAIAVAQTAVASETRLAARRLAVALSEAMSYGELCQTMRIF